MISKYYLFFVFKLIDNTFVTFSDINRGIIHETGLGAFRLLALSSQIFIIIPSQIQNMITWLVFHISGYILYSRIRYLNSA